MTRKTRQEAARVLKSYNWSGVLDEVRNVAIEALEQEPCGDAISRQAVLDELNKWDWQELYLPIHFKEYIIDVVPSVKPQERTGYISIDDAMSVFDDFMCGEVDEDGTDTFLEMLKDRVERSEE